VLGRRKFVNTARRRVENKKIYCDFAARNKQVDSYSEEFSIVTSVVLAPRPSAFPLRAEGRKALGDAVRALAASRHLREINTLSRPYLGPETRGL
jgi:hypothetical protein